MHHLEKYFKLKAKDINQPDHYVLEVVNERSDIRATYSEYEGVPYCNIRQWYDDSKPCKQGVTLGAVGFLHLRQCLGDSKDNIMMKEAYEEYVRELIDALIKKDCPGCVHEHPSQSSHSCFEASGIVNQCQFDRIESQINSWGYAYKLSEVAFRKGAVMKTIPDETFKMVHFTLREDVLKKMFAESDAQQEVMVV